MKKIVNIVLCLFCFLVFEGSVFAVCENVELNDWAEEVSAVFELAPEIEGSEFWEEGDDLDDVYIPEYAYTIKLSSIKDKIKVITTDSIDPVSSEVAYDVESKNYVIYSATHDVSKTYKIEIYMADDAPYCAKEKMRTITYTVPPRNKYIYSNYCNEHRDDPDCKNFIEIDDKKDSEISKTISEYEKENSPISTGTKIWNIIKTYGLYVLIPLLVVSIYYTIKIKSVKKKEDL